jgi:hypothetical protein
MAELHRDGSQVFSSKKCYECLTYLALDATTCHVCKKKVGRVDRNGIARKPIDWKSYISCAVALAALAVFIWKAFFN